MARFSFEKMTAMNIFQLFAEGHRSADERLLMRIVHSKHVANLSEHLASALMLPPRDRPLAWLIGLVHDVGRFEQFHITGSFAENGEVSCNELASKVLFEDGLLRKIVRDKSYDDVIIRAIENQACPQLPENGDAQVLTYSKILRDAVKIDNMRVAFETPPEIVYDVPEETLLSSAVSGPVADCFFAHRPVPRDLYETPIDHVVGDASGTYDLHYPESRAYLLDLRYHQKLFSGIVPAMPETLSLFERMEEALDLWLGEHADT